MSALPAGSPACEQRPGTAEDAVDGVVPAVVLRPADVDEMRAAVREAGARRQALVVSGRGRHLDVGAAPRRLHALVRTDRLDRVLAYEPGDMTVVVAAGCTLTALQATLAAHGQWLPLDPPAPEETTVGGLVAADLSGPLRAGSGRVRDSLIGIAVVGADGALVRGGGRVVKNVAGYDLPKLHVGALGTLGAIVEATFKVRPHPALESAVTALVPELTHAFALARALRDAVEPSWLEVVRPASLLVPGAAGTLVAVGVAGAPSWVEEGCARARRAAATRAPATHADGAALRGALGALGAAPAAAIVRVSTLPTDLERVVAPEVDALEREGVSVDLTAHAANGVARLAVHDPEDVPAVVSRLRAAAPPEATVVVERARPDAKARVDVWGPAPAGAALMARLKEAFDPLGVFAPGRVVAGL